MDNFIELLKFVIGAIAIIATAGVLVFGIQSCTQSTNLQSQLYYQTINNCTNAGGVWVNTDPQSTERGMCVKSK